LPLTSIAIEHQISTRRGMEILGAMTRNPL
jgi:hypothetical protein